VYYNQTVAVRGRKKFNRRIKVCTKVTREESNSYTARKEEILDAKV